MQLATGHVEDRYRPQLDALRAFFVVCVLITHFWQPDPLPSLLRRVDFGFIGVRAFFVLSGFLITRILLQCRTTAEESGQTPLSFVRRFYARRFLRIFPVYYLIIALAILVNVPPAREIWPWLVTYTSNVYQAVFDQNVRYFGHFWTLAVEEQFYLVWPWIVLYATRRSLPWIILVSMGVAMVYRDVALRQLGEHWGTLPFASLDTLGAGALLAIAVHATRDRDALQRTLLRTVFPTGVVTYFGLHALTFRSDDDRLLVAFHETAFAMICCGIIAAADRGIGGVGGRLLELRPIVFLGRISYGIYAYHFFMPWLLMRLLPRLGWQLPEPGPARFITAAVVTTIVAAASWYILERPVNRLKKFVPYSGVYAA
jgi:peptidoglycan/LPS O-acetylase OafA/YrhL